MNYRELLRKRLGLEQALAEIEKQCAEVDQLIRACLGADDGNDKVIPRAIQKRSVKKRKARWIDKKVAKKALRKTPTVNRGEGYDRILKSFKKKNTWTIKDLTADLYGDIAKKETKYYKRTWVAVTQLVKKGEIVKVEPGIFALV